MIRADPAISILRFILSFLFFGLLKVELSEFALIRNGWDDTTSDGSGDIREGMR